MREFAYRAGCCDHAQMAALIDFIRTLPVAPSDPLLPAPTDRRVHARPDAGRFAAMLDGLLRNRGFGPGELPFTGLSLATIYSSMLTHDRRSEHRWYQLGNMAGPLGWSFENLTAVAHEPPSERPRHAMYCHHLGQVYIAAIHQTTEQLIEIAKQADRPDQGAWRPVADGFAKECPDLTDLA